MEFLTKREILDLFDYSGETGRFYYKSKRNRKTVVGAEAGHQRKDGYRVIQINKKNYLVHRLVWAVENGNPPKYIDHINKNPSDNRIKNLRKASLSENGCNSRLSKASTTGIKGVYFYKFRKNPWVVSMKINQKHIHIGSFPTKEMAINANKKARKSIHGEFASC